jgi:hypothetical protein
MAHRGFDEQMAALEALKGRELAVNEIALIKKSLAQRSNFLVAKAARLAQDAGLGELMPDLLAAYDRFFTNAEKTDPQCWAKNALSRALATLECRDKDVFLRGLRHHQMEPTWGGRSDSAGTLRAHCAHALIACNGLDNQELLILLLDVLVDVDKSVRVEAARWRSLEKRQFQCCDCARLLPAKMPRCWGKASTPYWRSSAMEAFPSLPGFSRQEMIRRAKPHLH